MLSVQYGASIAKQLFAVAGPLWTVTLRICFSALMLGIVFRPRLNRLRKEQWRAAIPYGVAVGGMNLLFYCALDRIPLGLAVAVEFTGPLSVALLGSKRLLDLLWAGLAISGILLITPWTSSNRINSAGLLFALAAGVLWAAYIPLGRRLSRVFEGSEGVAVGMLAAALAVLPMIPFAPVKARFEPGVLLQGLAVAFLSSAVPYSLEIVALRAIPARTFGILMSLEPAVAAVCGWIVLGEVLALSQSIAIALIVAASAGATMTVRHVERAVEL